MTRITNFGRKRTYLQAGFIDTPTEVPDSGPSEEAKSVPPVEADHNSAQPPPKKKRKRTPKSKRDGHGTLKTQDTNDRSDGQKEELVKTTSKEKKKARADKFKRLTGTEARRQKRVQQRQANTTCFACRETGHAARDCPSAKANGGKSVGICYRCGSNRHSLSRCKKPEDPESPLPYALCFVCSQKGHLASTCPENKAKGLYPNGGCCKLCGENTHLAKDCTLRKEAPNTAQGLLVGTGREAGADEDDFHSIRRVQGELDREDKKGAAQKRAANVKVGTFSGVVKAITPKPVVQKKVVTF